MRLRFLNNYHISTRALVARHARWRAARAARACHACARHASPGNSLGVVVDLPAGDDGPDPADNDEGEEPLEDTNDDGGLLLLVVLGEDTSDDGTETTTEDADDEDDETHLGIKLDGVNLVVVLTHFLALLI